MDDKEHYWHDFPHLPRLTILPWVIWAVIIGLAMGAALYPALSQAEEVPAHVFEDEAVMLQLFAAPCESAEAKAIAARSPLSELVDKLQKAASNWVVTTPVGPLRMDFAGCWVAYTFRGTDGYAVAFEDGELRFFPAEKFKRTKGQAGT